MLLVRLLGGTFALAGLYYLDFYLLRQEATTIPQMVALFTAAGFLFFQRPPSGAGRVWFGRTGLPAAWPGWAVSIGFALAAATVFLFLDSDAHSASDAITRAFPSLSLIAALAAKVVNEHRAPDLA